jgi:hypothetical protein
MSERKPSKIDKTKWALYRMVAGVKPEKLTKAKWVVYGAVAVSSLLLFAADPTGPEYPKVPKSYGDCIAARTANTNGKVDMSERKPGTIDNVRWALYRTVADVKPEKLAKAKWVVYGAVAVSSMLLFAAEPSNPKVPKYLGD